MCLHRLSFALQAPLQLHFGFPFLLSEKGNFLHGLKKPAVTKEFIKTEMEN